MSGQKISYFAFDATTNLPKASDAANITAYVAKDDGALAALADATATEIDAVNAKGYYTFDLTQAETNADKLHFSAKSATANVVVIGVPAVAYTLFVSETRDLAPVQHVWQLRRSGDGALRSTNPLRLHRSYANIRAGWNCDIPAILPPGNVLSTMSAATSSDSVSGVDASKLGIDPNVAKVELDVDSDAEVKTYWITCTVTNSSGQGPVAIYGEVIVEAAP